MIFSNAPARPFARQPSRAAKSLVVAIAPAGSRSVKKPPVIVQRSTLAPPVSTKFPRVQSSSAKKPNVLDRPRSEEHTSELQSLMRISYAVFCLKKKKKRKRAHIAHIALMQY